MIYIITGGPVTGKGTRSDILATYLNIPHISTGEMLREAAETNKDINYKLSQGMLISDDITTELLKERILKEDCKNGFVIDGYPRTLNQVYVLNKLLENIGKSITRVIELTVPDELVYRRILERKQCENCGKMYGIDFPAKIDDVCDDCGGKLSIRTDDTKETLKSRIDIYRKNSQDILDYYNKIGLLKTVDASHNPETIIEDIK